MDEAHSRAQGLAQRQLDTRAIEIASEAKQAIASHERVCGERQEAILARFDEQKGDRIAFQADIKASIQAIHGILWKAAVSLVLGMSGLIVTLAMKLGHLG
jgi:hypothetical protein